MYDDLGCWITVLGASGVVSMCSVQGSSGSVPLVLLLAEQPEAYHICFEFYVIIVSIVEGQLVVQWVNFHIYATIMDGQWKQ